VFLRAAHELAEVEQGHVAARACRTDIVAPSNIESMLRQSQARPTS